MSFDTIERNRSAKLNGKREDKTILNTASEPPPLPQPKRFTREWSRKEMLAIPEWDGQRDTDVHLKKYLARPDFNPNSVLIGIGFATVRVGGKEYRIDGNTRSEADKQDYLKLPPTVEGHLYDCGDDREMAHRTYKNINSTSEGKTAIDRLTSALKVTKAKRKSAFFARGGGTSALTIAYNALHGTQSNAAPYDTEAMVREFKPEQAALDSLLADYPSSVMNSPSIQVAILLSLYRARHVGGTNAEDRQRSFIVVKDWWADFAEAKGLIKRGDGYGSSTPHIKLFNYTKEALRASSKAGTRSRKTWFELAENALYVLERADEDEIRKVGRVKLQAFCPLAK